MSWTLAIIIGVVAGGCTAWLYGYKEKDRWGVQVFFFILVFLTVLVVTKMCPWLIDVQEADRARQEEEAYMEEVAGYREDFEDHALLALNDSLDVWTKASGDSHGSGWFFLIIGGANSDSEANSERVTAFSYRFYEKDDRRILLHRVSERFEGANSVGRRRGTAY